LKFTNVYYQNLTAIKDGYKHIVNYGGSSSSKTISVLQLLRVIAESKPNLYILLVASSIPKIKTTILKDFRNIVMKSDYNSRSFNKQDLIYTFPSGSKFKFMNADDPGKFTGVRSDFCLMDEINTMRYGKDIFNQIDIRLKYVIIPTFNPASKFWITDVMSLESCKVIHSTYKDNQFIDKNIIDKLESKAKTDPNFYKVYTLGEWGALEGLVFKFKDNWDYYTKEPAGYDAIYYGGDFGFSNDPTTAVQVKLNKKGKELYVKEVLYQKGLLNSQISEILKPIIKDRSIVFDSAEPKSIASLRNEHGLRVEAALKGQDSIRAGIERLKEYKILVHENSKHLIEELFNYAYVDKEGLTNVPIDDYNHCIDALRYVALKYRL
jgi:phage terminase large subunit